MKNIGKRLFTGSMLRVSTLVLEVIVAFYLMPFVIHALGDRWYGLWVVIGTFIGYYGLMDVGLAHATERFICYAIPKNDDTELNRILVTSFYLFLGIGLLALVVTGIIVLLAPVFFTDPDEIFAFKVICAVMGLNAAISFPAMVLPRVFVAYLRYDYVSYVQFMKTVVRTALIIYFLSRGYSIIALAFITLATNILGFSVMFIMAKRLAKWMNLSWRYFTKEKIPSLFNFGIYAFIADIAQKFRLNIDNLVIAGFMDLAVVTHYNIAARLAGYFMVFMGSLTGVMTPVFTRYYSEKDSKNLLEKFVFTTRLSVLLSTLIAGAVILLMKPFIVAWMGESYADAYVPLVVLTAALLFEVMQIPSENLLYSMAKVKEFSIIRSVEAVFNLVFSLVLVNYYGMLGVALGTAIPLLVAKIWFQPRLLCQQLDYSYFAYWRQVTAIMIPAILVQLPLYWIVDHLQPESILEIMGLGGVYYLATLPLIMRFSLTKAEKRMMVTAAAPLKYVLGNA